MSEPLVALRELLRSLQDEQVDYLLFGAVSMLFMGYARTTQDVDVIIAPDAANIDRVIDWLRSIEGHHLNPLRPVGEETRQLLLSGGNPALATRVGLLDVVQHIDGLPPWPQMLAEAEAYEAEGLVIRVLNRKTLIAQKRRRASKQDLADIEALEALETM